MKAQSSMGKEVMTAWVVGAFSLALWMTFTPYLALEQARVLALCLATLCGFCILTALDRVRKKIALVRDLHWDGFHGSAA